MVILLTTYTNESTVISMTFIRAQDWCLIKCVYLNKTNKLYYNISFHNIFSKIYNIRAFVYDFKNIF